MAVIQRKNSRGQTRIIAQNRNRSPVYVSFRRFTGLKTRGIAGMQWVPVLERFWNE